MKEYGVGIIGFGTMGRTHTYAHRTIPFYYNNLPFKTRLVGVCSRTEETVKEAKEQFEFDWATVDPEKLINSKDIDIVHICTPNVSHKELLVKSIKAGKHVYCDKPMVISYDEALEVRKAYEEAQSFGYKPIIQIALQNRFFPAVMHAKQLVDSGKIGRIISYRACYLHAGSVDFNKPIGWKQNREIGGGGVLFDLGSHLLDIIYHLVGEYESISAKTSILYKNRPTGNGTTVEITAEDAIIMLATMKCGAAGTLEASKIATGTMDELRFEIHGDKGALRFNLMDPNWLEFYDNTVSDQPLGGTKGFTKIECVQRYKKPGGSFPTFKASIGWLRAHVHSVYNFVSCVDAGVQPSPSLDEGSYIQYVMEKAYESDKSGKFVEL
jgi:predicted dehydrogenase